MKKVFIILISILLVFAIIINLKERNIEKDDKKREDVYDSNGSCNGKINAVELPFLTAGENTISITGGSAFTVEITPNWRRK